ncbi:unnamed protein product [Boreogadus saida]
MLEIRHANPSGRECGNHFESTAVIPVPRCLRARYIPVPADLRCLRARYIPVPVVGGSDLRRSDLRHSDRAGVTYDTATERSDLRHSD